MQYAVFEGNMERLEKKLLRIYNKCKAYGCDFHYEVVGETFKEIKDEKGRKTIGRFLLVEAEGTAIVNDWEFVAAVEHTENGNIFTGILGIEIPDKYYNSDPICEHCNTNRPRKYTYIVRNKKTGDFKQVGKSCLKDYTGGMSAEAVTRYISLFDALIEGEAPEPGCRIERYLDVEEYLRYAVETIRCYGYVKTRDEEKESTASKVLDFYEADHGRAVSRDYLKRLRDEMERRQFDTNSAGVKEKVKMALEWIGNQREYSNYIHNLKTACSLKYVTYKNAGLLASLFPAYERDLAMVEKRAAMSPNEVESVHVGNVGEQIKINVQSVRCMTSWEGMYGTTHLYKIVGKDGNIYTWKTTKYVDSTFTDMSIKGTVKNHAEYRGIKQTELTRCYVTVIK